MEMTIDAALKQGIKAQKSGQTQEADRIYTEILQVQPKHPDANHSMGVLAASIGKVQEALPFFATALKVMPSVPQFWLSYIDVLIRLRQLPEARVVYDQAKSTGFKGDIFDELETKLVAAEMEAPKVHSISRKIIETPKASILDNLKLDQALKLAKKNAKDGNYEYAQKIYQDIIKKFPGNKKAASAIKLLSSSVAGISEDPPPELCSTIINLFTQSQFQKALSEAKKIVGIFPNSAFLQNIIGASNAGLRNFEAAVANYKKALKIDPDYADAHYSLGVALQELDDPTAAILSYNQALKIKPNYIEAYLNMGKIFKDTGDIEASISSYNQALKIKPDLTEAHYNMGNALKEKGDLDTAIASYSRALRINPGLTAAHYNMGLALKEKGDLDAAVDSYKRALKINPDFADAFNNMGAALKERGDFDAALECYNRALHINPNYADAYDNMGSTLMEKGDLNAAVDSYKKALKINPDHVNALNNIGVALKENGDVDAAIESYQQVLRIKPTWAEVYYNMGVALTEKGDLYAAIDSYKEALNIDPYYVNALNNIGTVLVENGDFGAAISSYNQALKINPDRAESHYNMGIVLKKRGDLDAAIDSFKRALKVDPDYAYAFNNLGAVLTEKGDLDAAINSYQQALKIKVNYVDCYVNLSTLKAQLLEPSSSISDLNNNANDALRNILPQNPTHQIIEAISNFMNGNLKQSSECLEKYKVLAQTPIIATLAEKGKIFCDAYLNFLEILINTNETIEHFEIPALYHIGESHCLSYAHSIIKKNKNLYYISPKITFGAKAYHFANQLENSYKAITRSNLKKIPRGSPVLISFGEIDCRIDEGIITASEKTGRKINELVDETVEGFVSWFINENIINQHLQYFFNVPAPTYTREISESFNNKRAEVVYQFNAALLKKLQNSNKMMLDVYEYTRTDKGFSNGKYHCDDFHLDARIIPKIQNQINL